jgi:hypothetical protein
MQLPYAKDPYARSHKKAASEEAALGLVELIEWIAEI